MNLYNIWTNQILMPKWLWFLVKNIAKPVKWDMARDSIDGNYVWEYIHYISDEGISEEIGNLTIYWNRQKAEEEKAKNTAIYLKKLLDAKWISYKEIDKIKEENKELNEKNKELNEKYNWLWDIYTKDVKEHEEENKKLKQENEELKNLPPVKVETLQPRGNWYKPDAQF